MGMPTAHYQIPTIVHGCAMSGDLVELHKLLQENPSLVYERDPVMSQTLLHVCAGNNTVEMLKYFLDLPGPCKAELEAKNMYGEAPLHVAAKNGCNESVQLLLARGGCIEAKANNGMTALHFAVGYALRAEDCSTVETLLEHKADCSVTDDEGMTATDYLSQAAENERLHTLLSRHLLKQKRHKAIGAATKAKMDELERELSTIVGLHEMKAQLRKWAKGMLLDERRKALGLQVGTRRPPHMAFLGNPGTGKTLVARVLGKLLHMVGILPTDKVTEVQRTDLVGEFVGHTGPKTRRKIKEAEGGILFVDEAYRLIPAQKSDDKDYGLEALEEIMSVMDSGKLVVIFAGYSKPMQRVIGSNEGFRRRVTKFFHFDDFKSEELAMIFQLKMNSLVEDNSLYGFRLHLSCTVEAISELINRTISEKQRKEMNGGLVDSVLVNARENLDLRLSFNCIDADELVTITVGDLEAGCELLSHQK
ncbi:unnamed protein product [Rhodiola kirilowii]